MFEAVGSRITALSRVRFGPLTLDGTLPPGAWRPLTEDEIAALRQAGGAGSPEEEAEENGEE
jgi:16S rRNA U516 pseudouridylate synthase RsuA-like enzyme